MARSPRRRAGPPRTALLAGVLPVLWPLAAAAQAVPRADTLRAPILSPITVSVTRTDLPLARVASAVQVVAGPTISKARPTWGLDEALATVPGVYAANRYNFSLDQRTSIRGFGARSSFGIRGIKVLLDGIPQTLPDGSGQLTNLELGAADRLEVLRGPSAALFGNASGGVISIRTDWARPEAIVQQLRVVAGTFSRHQVPIVGYATDQTWTKWQSSTRFRLGEGGGSVTVSRLAYGGERQHSAADFRNLAARFATPLAHDLTLSVLAQVGDDPRAMNPGALTAGELARNPDSAAGINVQKSAGKDVTQYQVGITLRQELAGGGEAALTLFGIARDLQNPQTFAYIRLNRKAYGARATLTRPILPGPLAPRLTVGLDFQRQRDDRLNFGNQAGQPDTVRQLDQLERVTEVGPFVQSALRLGPQTTLTAGARYDWVWFDARDRLVTPKNPDDSGRRLMRSASGFLGVAHSLREAATVYANVGTSFETPTTTELANRPDSAGGFNPALGPQRATSYEIGIRGELARRGRFSVAIYRADVRDELIAYQVPSSPGRVFFQNAGRSRHQGLELGADVGVVPGLRLTAAWTHSDFRYTGYASSGRDLAGRAIPGIPAAWLHLLWQLRPATARGAWAEIEQTHSSSFLVDDTLDTRTDPWWTTNLRLGWDGEALGARLGPFVGLNNVFDRHYVGSVVINAAQGRYFEPAPGRNFYAGLLIGAGR